MYARLRTAETLLHKKDVEQFIISLQVELHECLDELCTDGESFAKSPYCSPHSLQCVDFDVQIVDSVICFMNFTKSAFTLP